MFNLKNSHFVIYLLIIFAFVSASIKQDVNILLSGPDDLLKIKKCGVHIESEDFGYVKVLADDNEIAKLQLMGLEIFNNSAEEKREGRASFPSYSEIMEEIASLKNSYNELVEVDTIGFSSSQDMPVVRITITGVDRGIKPVYNLTGTTHGNEKVGSEMIMDVASELLDNYGSEVTSTKILDNSIVKLVPIQCPDGYINHSRYLFTGGGQTDPNRQFGWQVGYNNGGDNHGAVTFPFRDDELVAYYNNMNEETWYLCIDYHTGITCVMAPWFADVSIGSALTDYNAFKTLGDLYLKEMPYNFTFQGKGLWMGGMQQQGMPGVQTDWPYSRGGTLSFIVEASQSQSTTIPSDMNTLSTGNLNAVKNMIIETLKGVSGTVTNGKGEVLSASIEVLGEGFPVITSPKSGAFFKYIQNLSDSYTMKVRANGYKDTTVNVSIKSISEFNQIDIEMKPSNDDKIYALTMDYLRSYERPDQTDFHNALGAPDGEYLKVYSQGGWNGFDGAMLLFFGNNSPVLNKEGDDITVYAESGESYIVYAGNSIDKMDVELGTGDGETSFDLEESAIDTVRFIKIVSSDGNAPKIDAVEGRGISDNVDIDLNKSYAKNEKTLFSQVGLLCKFQISQPVESYSVSLLTINGREVKRILGGKLETEKSIDFSLKDISQGMYVINFVAGNYRTTEIVQILQ